MWPVFMKYYKKILTFSTTLKKYNEKKKKLKSDS